MKADNNSEYTARIFADGAQTDWKTNPYDYTITEKVVNNTSSPDLHLAARCGIAIQITKN